MKKKYIIILFILLFILLFPIKFHYKDGGTIEYRSLTYKIIKWNSLDEYSDNGVKTGTEIHFFPYNFKPIDYFREVRPPRFSLIYKDKKYYSNLLSYCWKNDYKALCVDTLGPEDLNYKSIIEVDKNEIMNYGLFIPVSYINLIDENGKSIDKVEYNNELETIKVPNVTGIYYLEVYYKCDEGSVSYSFKLNIK